MNGVYIALRFISLILIVLALMLLGADLVTSLEKGGHITVRSAAEVWSAIDKAGLASFQSGVGSSLPSPLSGWVLGLLNVWSWILLGVPGIILAFVFGRRTADVE